MVHDVDDQDAKSLEKKRLALGATPLALGEVLATLRGVMHMHHDDTR